MTLLPSEACEQCGDCSEPHEADERGDQAGDTRARVDRYSKDNNNDSESPKGDGGGAPSPAAAGKWGGATKKLRLRPQLTPENVSALLGVLPTSEESDLVRSHAAELKGKRHPRAP